MSRTFFDFFRRLFGITSAAGHPIAIYTPPAPFTLSTERSGAVAGYLIRRPSRRSGRPSRSAPTTGVGADRRRRPSNSFGRSDWRRFARCYTQIFSRLRRRRLAIPKERPQDVVRERRRSRCVSVLLRGTCRTSTAGTVARRGCEGVKATGDRKWRDLRLARCENGETPSASFFS